MRARDELFAAADRFVSFVDGSVPFPLSHLCNEQNENGVSAFRFPGCHSIPPSRLPPFFRTFAQEGEGGRQDAIDSAISMTFLSAPANSHLFSSAPVRTPLLPPPHLRRVGAQVEAKSRRDGALSAVRQNIVACTELKHRLYEEYMQPVVWPSPAIPCLGTLGLAWYPPTWTKPGGLHQPCPDFTRPSFFNWGQSANIICSAH